MAHPSIRTLVIAPLFSLCACVGGGDGSGGGGALVSGGDPCDRDGASADAIDGCNTCVCDGGTWACTRAACPKAGGGPCTDGDTMDADDGCNTCSCSGGSWACTEIDCGGSVGSGGDDTAGTGGDDTSGSGGDDGTGGTGRPCTPGELRPAGDGCNTCTCTASGGWACTEIGCDPGGGQACGARAGDTCGPTQYCAYEEGQSCGAADAQSVCVERPQICTRELMPVCGCDGRNYDNGCAANAAGTGILHTGDCAAL